MTGYSNATAVESPVQPTNHPATFVFGKSITVAALGTATPTTAWDAGAQWEALTVSLAYDGLSWEPVSQ